MLQYLTCALREVEARPVDRQQIDPGELRLLTLLDEELAAAGFRALGFGAVSPSVTYFGRPLMTCVHVNESIPAYALVRRHPAPEYGKLVELDVRTALACGDEIVTVDTPISGAFVPPGMHIESLPGLPVQALVERHVARVEAERPNGRILEHGTLQNALGLITTDMAKTRSLLRERRWVAPTTDAGLDRFTLRGAFALTLASWRPAVRSAADVVPHRAAPLPTRTAVVPAPDDERALRVEADLQALLHVAERPEPAPGTPWPLLTVIATTAAMSFVAMAAVWDSNIAALILFVVAFHEAGHAIAMRLFGYRDVHVFFVPLLGAVTVGRPAATTVRKRLLVSLAGPVPGLWLAVGLLAIDLAYGPIDIVRKAVLALLILNVLNLLPFTPLDGGRVLEALTRPESIWRLVVHGLSAAGLLALAAIARDPTISVFGAFWAAMLPRSLASYRLRRTIAATVGDRADFRGVARAALEALLAPPYMKLRAVTRQATARASARLFAESQATPADRRWGAVAYACAWIAVVVAVFLWTK